MGQCRECGRDVEWFKNGIVCERCAIKAEREYIQTEKQNRMHAESLDLQRRQVELLEQDTSDTLEDDVYNKRNTSEILFTLSQQRSEIRSFCDDILNSSEDLSETTLKDSLERITPFTRSLFALDSSYLFDFSHKQLLAEMCNEFRPLLQECENLMDAKRYKRMMGKRTTILRLCRELIDDALNLSPAELERKHGTIKKYIEEICAFRPTQRYVEPVKKMRDEFRHIIDEVNAARTWQVRCAEEETQARIDERFLPLGRFTPETVNAYFATIEHCQQLERKAESFAVSVSKMEFFSLFFVFAGALPGLFVLVSDRQEDGSIRGGLIGYVFWCCVICGSFGLIMYLILSSSSKQCYANSHEMVQQLNQYWPVDNAGKLSELLGMVDWKNDNWVVNKKTYEHMLELENWKIDFF